MPLKNRTIRIGLIVGLIGFLSVAVFYLVFDLLAARGALYTVDVLGKALFRELRSPFAVGIPMQLDVTAILLYSTLHLVVALAIGLVVVTLADYAARHRSRWRLVMLVIAAGFVVTIIAIGILTTDIRPVLPWWSIVVANTLAVILAGVFLIRKRPDIIKPVVRPG